jgi:hypothetical protein
MADSNVSQAEADSLILMEKVRADETEYEFPSPGEKLVVPLCSRDKREQFILDVSRGRIDLAKITYQNRGRQVVVLMRLDIGGAPHLNPDFVEVPCPHLHIYREGYGDKWAQPAPAHIFSNTTDIYATLIAFMQHCNITAAPTITRTRLF